MKTIKPIKISPLFLSSFALFILFFCGCASKSSPAPVDESNIDECQVVIPGISREYRLLFLTDSHIVLPETEGSQEIIDYSDQRLSQFTGETGIVSSDQFLSWISSSGQWELDALLLGGDIIDSPSPANVSYLKDSLERLEIPYIYALGNHDWTYPWEYMTEKGREEYLALLSPYMVSVENEFSGNTAFHTLELDDFIIAAINNSDNQIPPEALEEYKKIAEKGKPILLLLHVPFYTQPLLDKTSSVWQNNVVLGGGVHGGIYPNDVSAEFIGLITSKESPVAAVLAGHVHLSDISYIQGEKEILQITGDAGFKGKGTIIHITP